MKIKNLVLMAVLGLIFWACNNKTQGTTGANDMEKPAAELAEAGDHFGDEITSEDALSYSEMLVKLGDQDSMDVKVVGTVESVCQAKGCWMNIAANEEGQPEMFVKFKDYGFFVPKDISGKQVVMQGYAYREVTSVDELRHYAEDEGKSKEEIAAITEPVEELKFLASGVIVLK